jgi:hypothetical protein
MIYRILGTDDRTYKNCIGEVLERYLVRIDVNTIINEVDCILSDRLLTYALADHLIRVLEHPLFYYMAVKLCPYCTVFMDQMLRIQ